MMVTGTPTFPTGPEVGAPFPDFILPDQAGTPINFAVARGGARAMIVVHRSALW